MKGFVFSSILIMALAACNVPQPGSTSGQKGLRSDGFYKCDYHNLVYLVRFSNEGNVVLTAGHKDNYAEMIGMLDPTAPDQNNVYNVQYQLTENDSVYFHTVSDKGKILYKGDIVHTDTIRMLKKSLINGKEATLDYIFEAFKK